MNALTVSVYEQLEEELEAAYAISQQITMTADILYDNDFNVDQAVSILPLRCTRGLSVLLTYDIIIKKNLPRPNDPVRGQLRHS